MKNKILIGLIMTMTIHVSCAQLSEKERIVELIEAFGKAGDANDIEKLEPLLDTNYRIVMNRLFGSTEVSVIPKSVYLEKIKSKEWGGDKRQVNVNNVVINGNTASAKVTFKGTKMTFVSLLTLVKNAQDNWQLISDAPIIL